MNSECIIQIRISQGLLTDLELFLSSKSHYLSEQLLNKIVIKQAGKYLAITVKGTYHTDECSYSSSKCDNIQLKSKKELQNNFKWE